MISDEMASKTGLMNHSQLNIRQVNRKKNLIH